MNTSIARPMSAVRVALGIALAGICSGTASAADIGQVKTAKGEVVIERAGAMLAVRAGTRVETADVVRTGVDGSAGITMSDNSLLSLGPNSVLTLDSYRFDPTTYQGQFDVSLGKGSLAVVSGRIAKQSPEAMKLRTPAVILAVRGTEFAVRVDD